MFCLQCLTLTVSLENKKTQTTCSLGSHCQLQVTASANCFNAIMVKDIELDACFCHVDGLNNTRAINYKPVLYKDGQFGKKKKYFSGSTCSCKSNVML